jgi:hypothetical protein
MSVKTKIIGTVTALLLFLSANLFAQHIEMGFAAGFDIADLHYTNPSEAHFLYHISPTAAYNLNGFLSFRNNGLWGFSVEPGIIGKGWNQSLEAGNTKNKIRLYYFQLPVLSDFYLSNKLYFSIGPEMNYLLHARNKHESVSQNIAEYLNKFELSGLAAINYNINEVFTVSFRYSHGVTEIAKNTLWVYSETDNPNEVKDYNQYFQLLIKIKLKNRR